MQIAAVDVPVPELDLGNRFVADDKSKRHGSGFL